MFLLKGEMSVEDQPDKWRTVMKDIGGESFQKFMSLSMLLAAKVKNMQHWGQPLDIDEALRSYHLTDI